MLQRFADGIWTADGPAVSVMGFDYPTRMVVIRLSSGGLFVWSPVAASPELRRDLDALGPVRHIVAPNTLHHLFVRDWHEAYPAAMLHAVPRLRTKRPDLPWGRDLDDTPDAGWSADIDQIVVAGNRITTEVVFFHRPSRTAIFADLIQQFAPGAFSGWRALVARLDLLVTREPTVPRKFRVAFHNRDVARDAVRRILAWPTGALLTAHAPPVTSNGRRAIMRAFDWLLAR